MKNARDMLQKCFLFYQLYKTFRTDTGRVIRHRNISALCITSHISAKRKVLQGDQVYTSACSILTPLHTALTEGYVVHIAVIQRCVLTPWFRILFEKLIVTQLVKKHPTFLRNPKVHNRVHKSPPLNPILSQPNPVRPIDPYLPKVRLNVILPPTPRSSQWSLAFGPPNQNPLSTPPLPHACHMSISPHLNAAFFHFFHSWVLSTFYE
jgi:hypothetical protein